MAVQEVKVVSVPVSDQERAKEFYVEKLGFELSREDDSIPGIRWVQVTVGCANSVSSANRRVDQTQIDSVPPGWAGAFDDHAADLIFARAREPRNASGRRCRNASGRRCRNASGRRYRNASGRRWTRGVFECSLGPAV